MHALLLLLLIPLLANAQPDTTWSRSFALGDRAFLYDAVVVNDDVIVTCGYSQNGAGANLDYNFLLAAYSLSGDSLYARNYLETNQNEALEAIVHLGGDTVVACGWGTDGYSLELFGFSAESGDLLWQHTYAPSSGLCKGRDVIMLDDGRIAAVGYGLPEGETRSDAYLVVCDRLGDSLGTLLFGETGTDIANSIIQLPNGNLRLSGITRESSIADYDLWSQLISPDGSPIGSAIQFGATENDYCYNTVRTPDGDTWLVGRSGPAIGGYGYCAVLPATGSPTTRTYSSTGFTDQFRAALPWFGGMLFIGRSGDNATVTTFLMRSIDEDNQTNWTWRYGAESTEAGFYNIIQLPDGGALAVGAMAMPDDTSDVRGYLLRVTPPAGVRGTVIGLTTNDPVVGASVREVGSARATFTDAQGVFRLDLAAGIHDVMVSGECIENDTVFTVQVNEEAMTEVSFTPGEPYYGLRPSSVNVVVQNHMTGHSEIRFENAGTGTMSYEITAEEISPLGTWIAVDPAVGTLAPGEEAVIEVAVSADTTDDGVFEFIGEMQIHSNACPFTLLELPILVTVLDADGAPIAPAEFRLSPAFPNPFNSSTQVTLEIPQETEVGLTVFNIQGQAVKTWQADRMDAGSHRISIDLSGFGSGLYLLRAETPNSSATQKLLFVR